MVFIHAVICSQLGNGAKQWMLGKTQCLSSEALHFKFVRTWCKPLHGRSYRYYLDGSLDFGALLCITLWLWHVER